MPLYNSMTPEERETLYHLHDNRCDACGKDLCVLHAHHSDYRRKPDSVLCEKCHKGWHSKNGHGKYSFLNNPNEHIRKMLKAWSSTQSVYPEFVAGWLDFSETKIRTMCKSGELNAKLFTLNNTFKNKFWVIEKKSVVDWILKLNETLSIEYRAAQQHAIAKTQEPA